MKKFRDFITEEVVPSALVQNGSIELDKEEVRASINMALAKVTADGAVTPYIALNRIQKALAYFHIILPKRVYMEGAKGVEVHELRQFGHKMGMTDQGEFVSEVPGKYYLFMQYSMNTPMVHGGQKAWPTMGGTFRVMAKVVDQIELDRLVSMAELALAEECYDAEAQQKKAKMLAPHETMSDITSDEKKKGNKAAVADSEKGLKEEQIDEKQEPIFTHKKGPLYGTVTQHDDGRFSSRRKIGMHWRTAMHKTKEGAIAHLENDKKKKLKEEQIDELKHSTLKAYKSAAKADRDVSKEVVRKGLDTEGKFKHAIKKRKKGLERVSDRLDEKAPPGAKFERMVKHIKAGYAKDGLTKKEKGIAYATAWKAKNRQDEELKFDPSTEIPKN